MYFQGTLSRIMRSKILVRISMIYKLRYGFHELLRRQWRLNHGLKYTNRKKVFVTFPGFHVSFLILFRLTQCEKWVNSDQLGNLVHLGTPYLIHTPMWLSIYPSNPDLVMYIGCAYRIRE